MRPVTSTTACLIGSAAAMRWFGRGAGARPASAQASTSTRFSSRRRGLRRAACSIVSIVHAGRAARRFCSRTWTDRGGARLGEARRSAVSVAAGLELGRDDDGPLSLDAPCRRASAACSSAGSDSCVGTRGENDLVRPRFGICRSGGSGGRRAGGGHRRGRGLRCICSDRRVGGGAPPAQAGEHDSCNGDRRPALPPRPWPGSVKNCASAAVGFRSMGSTRFSCATDSSWR